MPTVFYMSVLEAVPPFAGLSLYPSSNEGGWKVALALLSYDPMKTTGALGLNIPLKEEIQLLRRPQNSSLCY